MRRLPAKVPVEPGLLMSGSLESESAFVFEKYRHRSVKAGPHGEV